MHKEEEETGHLKALYPETSIVFEFNVVVSIVNKSGSDGVDNNRAELQKLRLGQIFLPRAMHSQKTQRIVRIHHDMNPRVQQGSKVGITSRPSLHGKPPSPCNRNMVIDVKERNLFIE